MENIQVVEGIWFAQWSKPHAEIKAFSFNYTENGVKMETWNNIAGNELWLMTSNSRYPNKPDTTVKLASLESPRSGNNLPDSYGLRMTTYYKVNINFSCLHSCGNTGSIRNDPYWIFRKNSLEFIELSSINKVSLV